MSESTSNNNNNNIDFTENKIQIYQGVNDEPIAPTVTNGSNISYMHDKHNALIDNLITYLSSLSTLVGDNYNVLENEVQSLKDVVFPAELNINAFENLQNQLNSLIATVNLLDNRITTLENNSGGNGGGGEPTEDMYEFNGVNFVNGFATIGNINKSGTITKIEFHDFDNAFLTEFNTFFRNETTSDVFTNNTITEIDYDGYFGYSFTFTDATVTLGDSLGVEDTDGGDSYFINVKVYVLG